MACKYHYQGKEYSKEDFYNLVRTTMVTPRVVQKYNKIRFPSGNTASVIEGHTTLEEFKKQKEDRLKQINEQLSKGEVKENFKIEQRDLYDIRDLKYTVKIENTKIGTYISTEFKTKEEAQNWIDDKGNPTYEVKINLTEDELNIYQNNLIEKEALEKELERVEKEGFGALRPIYKFYEEAVQNTLKKKGYNPTRITDEYGNDWFEVQIKPEHQDYIILDASLSDLADGLKQAAVNQKLFENQIERLTQEAASIQKKVNIINDETLRTRMRDALRYVQDPEKKSDLKNFVYFVLESSEVLKHYVAELKKLPQLTTEEQITLIEKAKIISNNFEDLILFLKKDFRYVDDTNEFKKLVNELETNYDQIQTIYAAEAELLAVDFLAQELDSDAKEALKKLQDDIRVLEEGLAKARAAGAKESYQKRAFIDKIEAKKQQIITLVPDKTTIEETFKGLRGDLNWFSGHFRSSVAMGDPIISSYTRKLKEGFAQVRSRLIPIRDEAQSVLERYKRLTGRSTTGSWAKFFEGLYHKQTLSREENGEVVTEDFYSLLGPVNQGFYNKDLEFKTKIKSLKAKGADPKELDAVEKEYLKWLDTYAERRYSEAWYNRYNLLTPEAADARQEVLDELNNILRGPNRDSLSDSDVDRIGELKYKLKRLSSLRDDAGKMKTGQDLAIAESIQAFNKKTAEMSNWETTEENRKWFNIILSKKKDQLKEGLITQQDFDRWFSSNTQRNISQEFYKTRQVYIDQIQAIMGKLPKEQFKDDIKKLWDSILDVSKPYRDEDNILDGTALNQDESAVVRDNELKIEELKKKLIRFSGLTLEEERELQGLWGNLDTLTDEEIERFMELKEQKESYQAYIGKYISKTELDALINAFKELADISKWVPTDYYTTVFNQKLHEFRVSIDPNFLLDLDVVTQRFKSESEWYEQNHITKTKKIYNDGQVSFVEEDEPLYVWKDIIPTNEAWIEEDAPGFAFKTRIVKPEFINQNYENLNREFFRTGNPEDFRIVPKRYINEGGQVKLSSYINEDYERLRNDSVKSDTSKAKWDMLQFLTRTHLDGQQKVPQYKRLGYFLPGVVKGTYDKVLESGFKGIKEDLQNKWTKITQEDKDLTLGDTSQIELSVLPVKYSTKVKPEDQDLNLLEGVLQHRASVEEYEYLETQLPTANVIQSALRTAPKDIPQSQIDTVIERLGFKKFIKGTKESTRSKVFNQFIRTMFYGEMEHINFGNAKYNKWVNNAFALASLQVMTFNIPAHVTNLLSGEVQNIIESVGGKYMTFKDYLKAKSIYSANVHNFWSDYSKEGNKSFWSTLADRLDVPQGEFIDNFGRKTGFSRIREAKSHVMIIKQTGEHEMQVSTMIAMALNKKVKLNGKLVSLNEALEPKEGKIVIKQGAELTEEDLNKFQNKVHSVVRQLNGAYSKIDRTVAEKSLLGKLAFFMRKYFLPMFYRRFEDFKYDFEEQEFKEGYYRTASRILMDVIKLNTQLVKNWDTYSKSLTPEEKVNARRFFAEISIISTLALTILLIGGYDDERDLKGRFWYTHGLYQLMKVKSETETFIPAPWFGFDELSSLFSSPFVPAAAVKNMARTGKDVFSTVFQTDDAYFKRDYGIWSEGDLRLKADILKMLGINPNMATPENLVKNFELRNR